MWLQAPTIFSHSNSHITRKKSSHKKISAHTKTTFSQKNIFPDSDCRAVSHNYQFSKNFFYVDFCQIYLNLILCSQIGWVTFSLKYFPIMQCYECFLKLLTMNVYLYKCKCVNDSATVPKDGWTGKYQTPLTRIV